MTRMGGVTELLRRTRPCPLLSTTITSKSLRVCKLSDSRHSESLESAESVGIITETRISGKIYSTPKVVTSVREVTPQQLL